MFIADLTLSLQLWLTTFVLGLVSLPFATRFFPSLFDKGYFLGKMLGLFIISYALFLLSTLKLLPLGLNSLFFLTLIWAIINFLLWRKDKKLNIPWKIIIFEESVFLILNSLFIFIKGHNPEIYQIERFMDYGFIKSLTQSSYLPLEDIWRSGQPLNYYYFGHFLAFVLITLARLPLVAGFFLVQCWVFASAAIVAFVVGATFVRKFNFSPKWAIFAGLLSLFSTIFAGDWQTVSRYLNYVFNFQFSIFNFPGFWYPDPTRMIPGTISEIPIYSFLVSDLHAHVWGFLLGAVVIAALTSFWFQKVKPLAPIFILGFLLGLCIITNTWDYLTLGSITAVTLFLIYRRIFPSIAALALGLLTALPWLAFFTSPLSGFGLVTKWSPPVPWLLFWGPSLFLILVYFISRLKHGINFSKEGLLVILFLASIFWLVFLEVFYAKDILSSGEWFRANTYFKVSIQILLWVGLISGPTIFLVMTALKKPAKYFIGGLLVIWLLSRAIYPIKAINQSSLENKTYTGVTTGLNFWQTRFPDDFKAYQFLEEKPKGIILEADGDSYQDTSFFSTFLGWPTVSGWAVHEWTWHGSYDEVGKRAAEVSEVYKDKDLKKTKEILKKYHVKYIIIGSAEHRKYGKNLNLPKLKHLGKVIYQPNLSSLYIIGL